MIKDKLTVVLLGFATSVACLAFSELASAQDADSTPAASTPLVAEGVPDAESITMDKKRRSPVVSISTDVLSASQVRILADAYVPAEEYKGYPIEFKFFVNGSLRDTQIRSIQLPRPVGIVINSDVAKPPFNWTVVATLLHPNRQFVTVAQGAVFARDLGGTYSCSLVLGAVAGEADSGSTYVVDDVTAGQVGNSEISLNFASSKLDDGSAAEEVTAAATISLSGTTASGSLTTTVNGVATTSNVSGTATEEDGEVVSIAVQTSDGVTKLECE